MSNMSYCRFENTAKDLRNCLDNFDNSNLSETEEAAREHIIEMAVEIALDYGSEIDRELTEDLGE